MKIELFNWASVGAWSVLVDNEIVGSIEPGPSNRFSYYPKLNLTGNFSPAQAAEIEKAIQDFIAIEHIIGRLLK